MLAESIQSIGARHVLAGDSVNVVALDIQHPYVLMQRADTRQREYPTYYQFDPASVGVSFCPRQPIGSTFVASWGSQTYPDINPNSQASYGFNMWLAVSNYASKKLTGLNRASEIPLYADDDQYRLWATTNFQVWYHSVPRHLDRVNFITAGLHTADLDQEAFNASPFLRP